MVPVSYVTLPVLSYRPLQDGDRGLPSLIDFPVIMLAAIALSLGTLWLYICLPALLQDLLPLAITGCLAGLLLLVAPLALLTRRPFDWCLSTASLRIAAGLLAMLAAFTGQHEDLLGSLVNACKQGDFGFALMALLVGDPPYGPSVLASIVAAVLHELLVLNRAQEAYGIPRRPRLSRSVDRLALMLYLLLGISAGLMWRQPA